MRRERSSRKPLVSLPVEPFASAEEAWFWYITCQQARLDGVRFVAGAGDTARPCEPDDINRAATGLYRSGRLTRAHLEVLVAFGTRQSAPDARDGEAREAQVWDEALDRLSTVLRAKNIVLPLEGERLALAREAA